MRVPQTVGTPGWIILTYENNIPVCYWLNTHECKQLVCSADERICGDTIFRVEKLSDTEYVIADIWMYNSNCVHACSTFFQRYNWLKLLLKTFIRTLDDSIRLLHKSEIDHLSIRGYEEHPEDIGKTGYFVEKDKSELLTITKLSIPELIEMRNNIPDFKGKSKINSVMRKKIMMHVKGGKK